MRSDRVNNTVTEASHEVLEVRELHLLVLVALRLVLQQFLLRLHERVVVARVVEHLATMHRDDVRTHSVQEVLKEIKEQKANASSFKLNGHLPQ